MRPPVSPGVPAQMSSRCDLKAISRQSQRNHNATLRQFHGDLTACRQDGYDNDISDPKSSAARKNKFEPRELGP